MQFTKEPNLKGLDKSNEVIILWDRNNNLLLTASYLGKMISEETEKTKAVWKITEIYCTKLSNNNFKVNIIYPNSDYKGPITNILGFELQNIDENHEIFESKNIIFEDNGNHYRGTSINSDGSIYHLSDKKWVNNSGSIYSGNLNDHDLLEITKYINNIDQIVNELMNESKIVKK